MMSSTDHKIMHDEINADLYKELNVGFDAVIRKEKERVGLVDQHDIITEYSNEYSQPLRFISCRDPKIDNSQLVLDRYEVLKVKIAGDLVQILIHFGDAEDRKVKINGTQKEIFTNFEQQITSVFSAPIMFNSKHKIDDIKFLKNIDITSLHREFRIHIIRRVPGKIEIEISRYCSRETLHMENLTSNLQYDEIQIMMSLLMEELHA